MPCLSSALLLLYVKLSFSKSKVFFFDLNPSLAPNSFSKEIIIAVKLELIEVYFFNYVNGYWIEKDASWLFECAHTL